MSQPAAAALTPLPFKLVDSDGEPLETEWHTYELPLLRGLIRRAMAEQGRTGCAKDAEIARLRALLEERGQA